MSEFSDIRWICRECGEDHIKNSPPCKTCGSMQFTKVNADVVEEGWDDDDWGGPASWNWLHPTGPFEPLRKGTFKLALVSLPVAVVLFFIEPFQALALVYLLLVWPYVALAWAVMWVLDTVIGYVKYV